MITELLRKTFGKALIHIISKYNGPHYSGPLKYCKTRYQKQVFLVHSILQTFAGTELWHLGLFDFDGFASARIAT